MRRNLHFQTEVYRKMLDTYREQRAELGEGVEVPAHLFINHPDPAVCNAAVDILTSDDNYVPSKLWKQKEVHVESVEEILAQGVPKAVILYKSNAIKKLIDEQMQRLASGQLTEEEELEATTLINTLNCEKTNISHQGAADDSLIRSMSITPGDGIRPIQTVSPSRTLMMPALKFRFG